MTYTLFHPYFARIFLSLIVDCHIIYLHIDSNTHLENIFIVWKKQEVVSFIQHENTITSKNEWLEV